MDFYFFGVQYISHKQSLTAHRNAPKRAAACNDLVVPKDGLDFYCARLIRNTHPRSTGSQGLRLCRCYPTTTLTSAANFQPRL